MTSSLQLGPLALPLPLLLVALAAALGLLVGKHLGRNAGVDVEPTLFRMFLLGVVAARLGFVWEWRAVYLHEPWTLFDLRDGGWEPVAGFAAACLYGLARLQRQPALRKPIMAASFAMMVSWTAGAVAIAASTPSSRPPLPALSIPAADGGSVQLTTFIGKPTVVNLWATWCPPCRWEMPVLQRAQAAHPELNFVFVNQGESRDDVLRYLQTQGLALPNVLLDARRATGAAFNEQALPTTLFFDAQGRWVSTRVGALSEATLAERLAAIQEAAPGSAPRSR